MAVINESEFGRITAIYERQAQACVRSVEDFYDEITELSRKTAYEPLVNFTNQIYEFYKGELRDHLRREFANWYDSEYSLHALARSILAGEDAVEPEVWVFGPEGQDCPGAPEVHALGHAGQKIRDPPVYQDFDLGEQGLFELDAAWGGLVVLPGKTLGAVAGEGASIFLHCLQRSLA